MINEEGKLNSLDRQSMEKKMDQIMFAAMDEIQAGGTWNGSDEVRAKTGSIEDEIHRLFLAVLDGTSSLNDYRAAVGRWKNEGMQKPINKNHGHIPGTGTWKV